MNIIGNAVRSLFLTAAVSALMACSDNPEDTEIARPEYSPPYTSQKLTQTLFSGGGLAGLPGFGKDAILPDSELPELFSKAYGGRAPGTVFVTSIEGDLFDAAPFAAFRTKDKVILLVTHVNSENCHACAGRSSVYYFDTKNRELTKSFPLSISGNDWGEPQSMSLVQLPDGEPAGVFLTEGGNQGIFCSGYKFVKFAPDEVQTVARFPSHYSEGDSYSGTSIGLSGIGSNSDNRSLLLRYEGKTQNEDGSMKLLSEERIVTLDEQLDLWVDDWPYSC